MPSKPEPSHSEMPSRLPAGQRRPVVTPPTVGHYWSKSVPASGPAAVSVIHGPSAPFPIAIGKFGISVSVHLSIQNAVNGNGGVAPVSVGATRDDTNTTSVRDADGQTYVIVRETNAPHHTLDTAQGLPDDPYFGVIGTIGQGDPIDIYRLAVNAGTSGFQFELVTQQPLSTAPVQFWLFDDTGRVMGTWLSSPSSSGSSLNLEVATPFTGSSLFLGISGVNQNGSAGASAAIDYQLCMQRFTGSAGPTITAEAGASLPSITSALFVGALVQPLTTLGAAQSQGGTVAAGSLSLPPPAPSTAIGLRVGVGSLLTRSAEPSGGVVSEGDASTAALQLSAVQGQGQGGADRLLQAAVQNTGDETEPLSGPTLDEASGGLSTLRGPGGFPLLGAGPVGGWRKTPNASSDASSTPLVIDQLDLPPADLPASSEFYSAIAERAEQADQPLADASTESLRPQGWLWGTLSSGLSVVTLLTLNAVFSNPIAGFDLLTTHHDSDSKRSHGFKSQRRSRSSVDSHGDATDERR
jgi:hypothetical protein